MKKLFLLLTAVLMAVVCALAQTKTVSGTVVYAGDHEPLAGATVLPVGGGQGTATDIDGNFTLSVPSSVSKLKVSYVGMITKTVDAGQNIRIELDNSENNLDEVMVVAYGTAKKSAFTGSATVIDNAAIEKTQVTNVLNALSGKVTGMQMSNASGAPGASTPSMAIRGFSSVNAGNSPLIILDGTPFTGDMNTINTNDVESMTVLKDAASTALYGARGANGVIMITTKRAKLGEAKITVDAKWGSNGRAQQDYDYIKNPAQYYETYYSALNNYARMPESQKGLGMNPQAAYIWANQSMFEGGSSLGYNVYTVPQGQMLVGSNGKLNPAATLGRAVNYKGADYFLSPDNWMDETYKHSLRQEYNVSVTQGNEKSNFFASVGYLSNEGIVIAKSDFKRFSARLAADVQAKPWLKVGANVNYSHIDMNSMDNEGESASTGNIFAAANQIAPIYPLYVRNGAGQIMTDAVGNTMYDYGNGMNAGLTRPIFGDSNAVGDAILNKYNSEGNVLMGNVFAEIRFLKNFKFTSNNSMNLQEVRGTQVLNPYYGQYADQNGIVYKSHTRNMDYTYQQLLNYTNTFAGKHNVDIMAGHEYYKTTSYYLNGTKSNLFDPSNDELNGAIIDQSSGSYTTEYNNEGWIFRGMYDYDGKYFGQASFRHDASSRFHPDHRWGNFWSIGGAWILTKEAFMEDLTWIDFLKVKVAYGDQGNDNIGSYRYTNTYVIENAGGHPGVVGDTMGNPDISWEKNGNFSTGLEFAFLNSRISGAFEGFYRTTKDMLMLFPLPTSFGFQSYVANIGNMMNGGVSLELSGTPVKTRDLTWTINANITWQKNRITSLPTERKKDYAYVIDDNGNTTRKVYGYSSGSIFYGEGESMYSYYTKKYAGVDKETGLPLYYKNILGEDNKPTGETELTTVYSEASDYIVGVCPANVFGGFSTQLQYRDFDLSVAFNYQIGGKVYDSGYASLMGAPSSTSKGSNIHADALKAWTPENADSDTPRFFYGDQYAASSSSRFLTDASYLSLENINVGYTLPAKLTRKAFIEKVRVYLACDNVWVWSKRQGLDPRQSFTSNFSGGEDISSFYSGIRTISGGLTVTF